MNFKINLGLLHYKDESDTPFSLGFLCGSASKESAHNAGDLGLIPGLGRFPGEGRGCPLQYSGLENSMNHTFHGIIKNQTLLSNFLTFDSRVEAKCFTIILLIFRNTFFL